MNHPENSRSVGVKLLLVSILAILMTIPALFVGNLVDERAKRAEDVSQQISSQVGGRQIFLGPTLVIPFSGVPWSRYLVFPATASAVLRTRTEERRRSLFRVPVFQADLKLDASFDLTGVPAEAPAGEKLDWSRAQMVVGVSDARGALADATLTADGKTLILNPTDAGPDVTIGETDKGKVKLALFGTAIDSLAKPDAKFSVTSTLRFSGAQRVAVLAYGKTTRLSAQGDWPDPGFDGGFLPVSRTVSKNGFNAEWSVPFIARGVRAEGTTTSIPNLDATALGTSFIEVANPYQSVSRSLKYVLLFVGLIFLSYFVFEVTTGRGVHPAQYVLVGIAQIIFYLLLLSFAERTGFDLAFLIGGASTVSLLSVNAAWVFVSRLQGARAFVSFSLLYAMIYMLLRMEDNALLVGSVASFLAVAAVMYFTRRIDWHSPLESGAAATELKADS